jgi:hypothetical protein
LSSLASDNIHGRDVVCCFLVNYQIVSGVPPSSIESVVAPLIALVNSCKNVPVLKAATKLCAILCGHTQSDLLSAEDWRKVSWE